MRALLTAIIIGVSAAFVPSAVDIHAEGQPNRDASELLRLHVEVLEAHKANDVNDLLAAESDEVIRVSRGDVVLETKSERSPRFKQYLESTKFDEYKDLIEPIVRVSDDGTLGWVIAQVRVRGVRSDSNGEDNRFDTVWAWIELYEKKNGRWYRTGNVSNAKPEIR